MRAAFRNHLLQKGIELQRLNQMQGPDAGTAINHKTAADFPHGRRLFHTKSSGFIEFAEPLHHALPRPCGGPMRFHERPVRCASSILLLKILGDEHSRGCDRRISHPPDTEFSRHHVSTFQTRTFAKSRSKNTAIYFPAVTDFFTSGEVGLVMPATSLQQS